MFRILPRNVATVCRSCRVKYGGSQKRLYANAPASATNLKDTAQFPVNFGTSDAARDDGQLREIFDSTDSWKAFTLPSSTGLFHNSDLSNPRGFERYATRTLKKARRLVDKIQNGESNRVGGLRTTVRDLDRLSDLLCRVIDMADFVRSTHPDSAFVRAADKAYTDTYEYMNVLNTQSGLYDALKHALESQSPSDNCTVEELAVARILMNDFEKSGINMQDDQKNAFVQLTNEIARLGALFISNPTPKSRGITYASHELMGMDPMVVRELTSRGRVHLSTTSPAARHALKYAESESVRKDLYIATHSASDTQIDLLEQMLLRRKQLATLVGFPDYASLALVDKMAKNHTAVQTFLNAIAQANKPAALHELRGLMDLKKKFGHATPFAAWDRDYYSAKQLMAYKASHPASDSISEYFSLGSVIQGLSRLFNSLYGIRLVPRPTAIGETWNTDVRRLDVISETDGHIAVMYCDLYERPGKSPNPAHFTIRCSRKIAKEEVLDEDGYPEDDGMPSVMTPSGDAFQLPTIALICDFARQSRGRPTLLSFREVQTLFHEMGHAVHSMLGRTELHNVAGTRCVTDFAELPSVLMESFAKSPAVLSLFAKHYKTGEPLPLDLLHHQLEQDWLFEAIETRSQIVLALLDQAYHVRDFENSMTTTQQFYDIENTYGILPPVEGVSWQGFFTHLYGYGGTYYSYLFDRAIAAKVWRTVFERNPTSRDAGEKWKNDVLKWGGSRDPWHCIADVLGQDELKEGGPAAMKEVGSWGAQLK